MKIRLISLIYVILSLSVFSDTPKEVQIAFEDKYSYREWTEDEKRILLLFFEMRHFHSGDARLKNRADNEFRRNRLPLSAKIAKEIIYTEDYTNAIGLRGASESMRFLEHGYSPDEIIKIVRDNLPKILATNAQGDYYAKSLFSRVLGLVSSFGTYEDLDIVESIEKAGYSSFSIMKAKEALSSKIENTQNSVIKEKPLPGSEETQTPKIPEREPKPLSEQSNSEEN